MRPAARLQSAIDIVDAVIAAAREGGAAADTLAARWFASHRFAGSKDKAAIRELLYAAIRFTADRPVSGRAAFLGLAASERPDLLPLFDGSTHAPAPPQPDELRATPSLVPERMQPLFAARFGDDMSRQLAALIARAPFDLRVQRGDRDAIAAELGAAAIPGLPNGIRLPAPVPLERHPLLLSGAIEVQDAGSQHVVALAAAAAHETVVDLCAGAGGKTLGLAQAMSPDGAPPSGRLIATDTDRARLQAMTPRLQRAGIDWIERRLLNPGREAEALADLPAAADLVLVDAPCSGTGTWRRNPELRWRLTTERLARLTAIQSRLIDLALPLLKPDGRLVYAVCSVLDAEGPAQAEAAAARHGLIVRQMLALTPADNGCDGFFVALLGRPC